VRRLVTIPGRIGAEFAHTSTTSGMTTRRTPLEPELQSILSSQPEQELFDLFGTDGQAGPWFLFSAGPISAFGNSRPGGGRAHLLFCSFGRGRRSSFSGPQEQSTVPSTAPSGADREVNVRNVLQSGWLWPQRSTPSPCASATGRPHFSAMLVAQYLTNGGGG